MPTYRPCQFIQSMEPLIMTSLECFPVNAKWTQVKSPIPTHTRPKHGGQWHRYGTHLCTCGVLFVWRSYNIDDTRNGEARGEGGRYRVNTVVMDWNGIVTWSKYWVLGLFFAQLSNDRLTSFNWVMQFQYCDSWKRPLAVLKLVTHQSGAEHLTTRPSCRSPPAM